MEIPNFSEKRRSPNTVFYSDSLHQNGNVWRLKVYPNGAGAFKNSYISIFVELVKGWPKGGSYSYKITMRKSNSNSQERNL